MAVGKDVLKSGKASEKVGSTQWKDRLIQITANKFLVYEGSTTASPLYAVPLSDVTTLNALPASMASNAFQISTKKKNFTYRCQASKERDDWVEALTKCTNVGSMLQKNSDKLRYAKLASQMASEISLSDHKHLAQSFADCFVGKDAVQWLMSSLQITREMALEQGRMMMKLNFIESVRGKDFEDSGTFYRFVEDNILESLSHVGDISQAFGSGEFNAQQYALQYLQEHTEQEAEAHCLDLLNSKSLTETELKREVCQKYQSFISASEQIRSMEADVGRLKRLVQDFQQHIQELKGVTLIDGYGIKASEPVSRRPSYEENNRQLPEWVEEALSELELLVFERNYKQSAELIEKIEGYISSTSSSFSSSAAAHSDKGNGLKLGSEADPMGHVLQQLRLHKLQFRRRIVEELSSGVRALQCRSYQRRLFLLLSRLGMARTACDLYLHNQSALLREALRTVRVGTDLLEHTRQTSRTVFGLLKSVAEEFAYLFSFQNPSMTTSFVVWMTENLSDIMSMLVKQLTLSDTSSIIREVEKPSISLAASKAPGSTSSAASQRLEGSFREYVQCIAALYAEGKGLEDDVLPCSQLLRRILARDVGRQVDFFFDQLTAFFLGQLKQEKWVLNDSWIGSDENGGGGPSRLSPSIRVILQSIYVAVLQMQAEISFKVSIASGLLPAVIAGISNGLRKVLKEVSDQLEGGKLSSEQVAAVKINVNFISSTFLPLISTGEWYLSHGSSAGWYLLHKQIEQLQQKL